LAHLASGLGSGALGSPLCFGGSRCRVVGLTCGLPTQSLGRRCVLRGTVVRLRALPLLGLPRRPLGRFLRGSGEGLLFRLGARLRSDGLRSCHRLRSDGLRGCHRLRSDGLRGCHCLRSGRRSRFGSGSRLRNHCCFERESGRCYRGYLGGGCRRCYRSLRRRSGLGEQGLGRLGGQRLGSRARHGRQIGVVPAFVDVGNLLGESGIGQSGPRMAPSPAPRKAYGRWCYAGALGA